jgi:hypothetical protein
MEPGLDPIEPGLDPVEARLDPIEAGIDLIESPVHRVEATIHRVEPHVGVPDVSHQSGADGDPGPGQLALDVRCGSHGRHGHARLRSSRTGPP